MLDHRNLLVADLDADPLGVIVLNEAGSIKTRFDPHISDLYRGPAQPNIKGIVQIC
jgi:hypothetical protein